MSNDTSYLSVSEIPESKCEAENVSEWYDYEAQKAVALPPVGIECEYEDSPEIKGYSKCTILAVLNDAFAFSRPDYKNTIFTGNFRTHTLRPLDHNRKAEAEKHRVTGAALQAYVEIQSRTRNAVASFDELYDLGFLRMPAE